jgi:ATP-binding cassette subfamily F protein 3
VKGGKATVILLQAARVSKSFGARQVLTDVNFSIQERERAGIVGINGAGKSTLLKILTGSLTPDTGEVSRARDLKLSYLAQDGGLESTQSIWQEMLAVFAPLLNLERQLRDMESKMSDPSLTADTKAYGQLLQTYDNLSSVFKNRGGFEYEASIRGVLRGLKFAESDLNTPVGTLSGGQKTRLALARCLLGEPDLLILDEPTNYLDLDNLAWLEQYLRSYRGAVLVVSHDRYFLDTLAEVIYELERGAITCYTGNYTRFVQQKAEAVQQQIKDFNRQQAEIARMEEFVRRNIAAKDTTRRAQSRLKVLEKMERLDKPVKEIRASVSFSVSRASGREVLQAEDLCIGYPGLILARSLNFEITRGERVALVGPNGIGKSTLLKTIAGRLPPRGGRLRTGNYVQMGYYDQEQQGLTDGKQVLQELWDRYPRMNEADLRKVLGRFLFRGDDVLKQVADLSGGEKSRLALASLMLQKANFLLLDEPTNHLDLPGREVLEDALTGYPGTILFVSHDRYFINKIASGILELTPEGTSSWLGNYDDYVSRKAERTPPEALRQQQAEEDRGAISAEKEQYLQRKEEERQKRRRRRLLKELEETIAGLEDAIARLEGELALPEVYQDYQACLERQNQLEQARSSLDVHLEKWLELAGD